MPHALVSLPHVRTPGSPPNVADACTGPLCAAKGISVRAGSFGVDIPHVDGAIFASNDELLRLCDNTIVRMRGVGVPSGIHNRHDFARRKVHCDFFRQGSKKQLFGNVEHNARLIAHNGSALVNANFRVPLHEISHAMFYSFGGSNKLAARLVKGHGTYRRIMGLKIEAH